MALPVIRKRGYLACLQRPAARWLFSAGRPLDEMSNWDVLNENTEQVKGRVYHRLVQKYLQGVPSNGDSAAQAEWKCSAHRHAAILRLDAEDMAHLASQDPELFRYKDQSQGDIMWVRPGIVYAVVSLR